MAASRSERRQATTSSCVATTGDGRSWLRIGSGALGHADRGAHPATTSAGVHAGRSRRAGRTGGAGCGSPNRWCTKGPREVDAHDIALAALVTPAAWSARGPGHNRTEHGQRRRTGAPGKARAGLTDLRRSTHRAEGAAVGLIGLHVDADPVLSGTAREGTTRDAGRFGLALPLVTALLAVLRLA